MTWLAASVFCLLVVLGATLREGRRGVRHGTRPLARYALLGVAIFAAALALREQASDLRWAMLGVSVSAALVYLYWIELQSRLPRGNAFSVGSTLPDGSWTSVSPARAVPVSSLWPRRPPTLLILYRGPW